MLLDWKLAVGLLLYAVWKSSEKKKDDGKKHEGGRFWSDRIPGEDFEGFDWQGNGLAIDTDCERVAEGAHFFPFNWATMNTRAEEASTLDATLSIARDNTAMGFVDYLTDQEGITDPLVISARILEEASPQCASVPASDWGPHLRSWYTSLVQRVTAYVGQETIG